jgi:hypothetical protein
VVGRPHPRVVGLGAREVQRLQQRPSWQGGSRRRRRDGCRGVEATTDCHDHGCPRGQLVHAEMFGARPVYRQRMLLPPGRPGHPSSLGRGHHVRQRSGALSWTRARPLAVPFGPGLTTLPGPRPRPARTRPAGSACAGWGGVRARAGPTALTP